MTALLVIAGAAVGAPLRYLAGHVLDRRVHWGTLLVNLSGSFLLGWLVSTNPADNAMALFGTGFCGALTTYSAMAVQALESGPRRGLAYALASVAGSLAMAWLGLQLG